MNVAIDSNPMVFPLEARDRLKRRLGRIFRRLKRTVAAVHVTLDEQTRGQQSKKICYLRIDLARGGQVLVKGKGQRVAGALFDCVRRARRLLVIQKKRHRRRQVSPTAAVRA